MKSIFLLLFFGAIFNASSNAQSVSVNTTGAAPNASAMLDVSSNNKGVLVPRVSLTSALDVTTVLSPAVSLLVYNTATAGTYPNNIIPGFYYWQTNKWNPVVRQTGIFSFAEFYALMPSDNPVTIAPGGSVTFPNAGPNSSNGIIGLNSTNFLLSDAGTYMVSFTVTVNEPGQLALNINGAIIPYSVFGRSAGSSQITGQALITVISNSTLTVDNPPGSSWALTIPPFAGGTTPVAASLIITRIQ